MPKWTPPVRNREQIQFADLRKTVDPPFEDLHDTLSDAYYNFWRQGQSKPWHGYDVLPTRAESKAQFDKLHGLVFLQRDVTFHEENLKQPKEKQIPEAQYNPEVEHDDGTGKKKMKHHERSKAMLEAAKAEGFDLAAKPDKPDKPKDEHGKGSKG